MSNRTGGATGSVTRYRRKAVVALWSGSALCLALVVLIAFSLAPRIERGLATLGWDTTEGVLLYAEQEREVIRTTDEPTWDYWVSVRYAYTAPSPGGGSNDLTGVRYDVDTGSGKEGGKGIGSAGKARMAARHAPAATVYYNPEAPEESLLRPGISYGASLWFIPGVWLIGIGYCLARMAVTGPPAEVDGYLHPAWLLLTWVFFFGFGAPLLMTSVTTVLGRGLDLLPSPWVAIGLSLAGLLALFAPGILRSGAVKTAFGLSAPFLALLLLSALGLGFHTAWSGATLPSWTPGEDETLARLAHPNARVRESACWTIGRARTPMPPPDVVASLIADPDEGVAGAAMFMVKETGINHPAIAAKLTRRLHDPSEKMRQDAAWRLAGQKAADPEEAIEGGLALLRDGETSQRAGLSLLAQIGRGRLDAAEAVAALVRDPESPTRGQAIWTLELMKADHDVALDAVFSVLAEGDEDLRRPAVHYLAEVGRPVDAAPRAAVDAIASDLTHRKSRRRQDAVRALARLGPGALAARSLLDQTAATDGDALTRHLAGQALAALRAGR